MGATLSEPVTDKKSVYTQSIRAKVGASCMQGWRQSMEDSHTILLAIPSDEKASFFGVFDGHGGELMFTNCGRLSFSYLKI